MRKLIVANCPDPNFSRGSIPALPRTLDKVGGILDFVPMLLASRIHEIIRRELSRNAKSGEI